MKKSELKKLIKESLLGEQISIGDFSKEQSQNSDLYLQKVKMTSKKIINRDNPREKLTYGDFAPEGVEKFFGRSTNELEGFNRHKWIEDVKQLTQKNIPEAQSKKVSKKYTEEDLRAAWSKWNKNAHPEDRIDWGEYYDEHSYQLKEDV